MALMHVLLCALLFGVAWAGALSLGLLLALWAAFCAGLALRGPAGFSEALALPPIQMGRASAMLMLCVLLAGAAGTQTVAPFMAARSGVPLALTMLTLSCVSLWLVVPYPRAQEAA